MDKLPNELIREILYPEFHVPDETFRNISDISPFFRPTYQPCSLLLQVCKRWMIVGTPLLYHVVVLRSEAQAQALQRTLRQHVELGAYIKRLRVEGGFGTAMHTIVISAPYITDLGLSLDIHPSDSVRGLVSSLATLNPTCLVILGPVCKETSTSLHQLHEKVMQCFKIWSNVNEIIIPRNFQHYPFPELVDILDCALPENLQTVTIPVSLAMKRCSDLDKLVMHRSLKRIWLVLSEEETRTSPDITTLERLCTSESLRGIVAPKLPGVKIKNGPHIALPHNPLYVPLDNVTKDISDFIWDRILRFAIEPDPHPCRNPENRVPFKMFRPFYMPISKVSKTFRRLALPYINGTVHIGHLNIRQFAADLQRNPARGPQIRIIRSSGNEWLKKAAKILHVEYMGTLLSQAPHLVSFGTPHHVPNRAKTRGDGYILIDWPVFETLAITAGANLAYLFDVVICDASTSIQSPSPLSRFTALRELSCGVQAVLDTGAPVSPDWLPSLEVLRLHYCNSSFLDVLSVLSLHSLRELEITQFPMELQRAARFLQVHGLKIVTLTIENRAVGPTLDLCPNTTKLTMNCSPAHVGEYGILKIKKKHENLSKIIFGAQASHYLEYLPSNLMSRSDYFMFPALCEIQVLHLQWPVTEYEISKSPWPECSEKLVAHGINLVDPKGIAWRPRLQCS